MTRFWHTALVLVAVVLGACATPIVVSELPVAREVAPRRIALIPLAYSFERLPTDPPALSAPEAAELVTSRVLGALSEDGLFEVIPPTEAASVLSTAGALEAPSDPARVGQLLRGAFGVDAYLAGTVFRFRQRQGGREGAMRPASVRFDLELRAAADGQVLWSGSYDETQASVSSRAEYFGLAWDRGFRWLSAEELASYGARALVEHLHEAASRWR